jgi:hypothetical protein
VTTSTKGLRCKRSGAVQACAFPLSIPGNDDAIYPSPDDQQQTPYFVIIILLTHKLTHKILPHILPPRKRKFLSRSSQVKMSIQRENFMSNNHFDRGMTTTKKQMTLFSFMDTGTVADGIIRLGNYFFLFPHTGNYLRR